MEQELQSSSGNVNQTGVSKASERGETDIRTYRLLLGRGGLILGFRLPIGENVDGWNSGFLLYEAILAWVTKIGERLTELAASTMTTSSSASSSTLDSTSEGPMLVERARLLEEALYQ
jgi:hypothetical protein